jgi:hypothetical protein
MNTTSMREFYRRAGYRVVSTPSSDWYVPGGRVYRSFPCGKSVMPTSEEVAELYQHRGILGVEFHNARGIGVPSGIWMLHDKSYDQRSVTRQYRQQMSHALERETVREIDFDELHRLGMRANLETLARQNHHDNHFTNAALWRQLCDAGRETRGAGAFASFGPEGLTGYLVYFIADGVSHGLMTKSLDAARHTGSNHALYFTYAHTMIRRPGIDAVAIGAQWVPPMQGVDRIKRHGGFDLEPHHVAVFLRPGADAMLLSGAAAIALKAAQQILGHSDGLDRALALRDVAKTTADSSGEWNFALRDALPR